MNLSLLSSSSSQSVEFGRELAARLLLIALRLHEAVLSMASALRFTPLALVIAADAFARASLALASKETEPFDANGDTPFHVAEEWIF